MKSLYRWLTCELQVHKVVTLKRQLENTLLIRNESDDQNVFNNEILCANISVLCATLVTFIIVKVHSYPNLYKRR